MLTTFDPANLRDLTLQVIKELKNEVKLFFPSFCKIFQNFCLVESRQKINAGPFGLQEKSIFINFL
jgi:hypothetical protein